MTARTVGLRLLLTESIRRVAWAALLVFAFTLLWAVVLLLSGGVPDWYTPIAILVVLSYFAGPTASASIHQRRRAKRWGPGAAPSLTFCALWGAAFALAFVALLQATQGMTATLLNYLAVATSAGLAAALISLMPVGNWR